MKRPQPPQPPQPPPNKIKIEVPLPKVLIVLFYLTIGLIISAAMWLGFTSNGATDLHTGMAIVIAMVLWAIVCMKDFFRDKKLVG